MAIPAFTPSTLTDECPITIGGQTWFVTVRRITPPHNTDLMRRATRPELDKASRQMVETFSQDTYSRLFCREAVTGWEGLTPDILAMMVEDFELDGTPVVTATAPGPDGEPMTVIPFDPALAEKIWNATDADNFANPVFRHNKRMLELIGLRKEYERKNSAGSSVS